MEIVTSNLDNTDHWIGLQLKDGQVRSYFTQPINEISTRRYPQNWTVITLLLFFFKRIQAICLLCTLITIIAMPSATPFALEMYATEILLLFVVYVFKEIYFDSIRSQSDSQINKRTVNVFRGGQQLHGLEWGEVRQGDIVYLTNGQLAPADLLLLDSQQIQHRQAISFVDTKNINGQIVPEKKKACFLTQMVNKGMMQKRNWTQYKKIITGKLNYERPNGKLNEFTAYLKVSKDPKVQKLSIENLILRESVIKTSLWVYGLVIYSGMDSKIMMNLKNKSIKTSAIEKRMQLFYYSCLALNLAFGFAFGLIYMLSKKQRLSFEIAAYHFLMFSLVLPHALEICKNLFLIFICVSKKIQKSSVRNFKALLSLGNIDFAVVANTGVISSGEVVIDQIVSQSSIYEINSNEFSQEKRKSSSPRQRRQGSSSRSGNPQASSNFKLPFLTIGKDNQILYDKQQSEYDQFQIDDTHCRLAIPSSHTNVSKLPKLKTSLQPLKIDKTRLYNFIKQEEMESTEIMKSIVLCHQARLFYIPQKEAYRGLSCIQSQQVLLKLANYLGWELQPKLDGTKELGIIIRTEKQKLDERGIITQVKNMHYEWVGINHFATDRKLFSVVVLNGDKYTLYCKGKPQDIIDRLKVTKQTQKIIDSTVSKYKANQSQAIVFSKREMSLQEKQIYESEYASLKLSLTTTEKQIQDFSKKYERNLQFICIVGLSTQVNSRSDYFFNFMSDCCIKICMLASKRSELQIFKQQLGNRQQIEYIYLQKDSSELLRYYLDYATEKQISKKDFKYALIINASSWRIMQSNSDIMQHFLLCLYNSQGLLAFDFQPHLAADLTRRIKVCYPRSHGVLGIGHSYCDLQFLQQTDVGIGVSPNLPSDIMVQNLDRVVQMLKIGPYILQTLTQITNQIIYGVVCITTIILIYEIALISVKSSMTLNPIFVFIYIIVFTFLQAIFSLISNRKIKKLVRPAFYVNFTNLSRKMFLTILQAFCHGTVIIIVSLLTLPHVRINNGKLLPIEASHFAIFIQLILVGCLRHLFNSAIKKIFVAIYTLITILVVGTSVVLTALIVPSFANSALQFPILMTNYDSITMICNSIIFCTSISLLLMSVIKKKIFPQVNDIFSKLASNEVIKKHIKANPEFDCVQLVKHLYSDQENMDASVSKLVQEQMDVNSLKINNLLQIRKKQSNVKYLYQNFQKNSRAFMLSIAITFGLMATIFVFNSVEDRGFETYQVPLVLGMLLILCFLIYAWRQQHFMNHYYISNAATIINVVIIITYTCLKTQQRDYYLLYSILILICTQLIEISFLVVLGASIAICLTNLILQSIGILVNSSTLSAVFQVIATIIIVCLNLFTLRKCQISSKTNFLINQSFENETNHINDVLSILVPKFVKNHLEKNLTSQDLGMQQQQKQAAVLFCYVCNFAEIVKEQGKNVVLLMDQLFRQYDQLAHNYAVQKIQTVGMTYMAATGIKFYEDEIDNEMKKKNHVQRLLKMAIQMVEKAKSITWGEKKNKRLDIKVGINCGDVIVGVIGYHKPQFSLIGDAVNTTSRHCSTGEQGDIVLSEAAFRMVKRFPASSFKRVEKTMKGLGVVNTYRYLKNQISESRHLKIRARFIAAVKKVIQRLKQQGKINYKSFKASELAKHLMELRSSTKKLTEHNISHVKEQIAKRSDQRKASIFCLQADLNKPDQTIEEISKQGQIKDDEIVHNALLQLVERNKKYDMHCFKKSYLSDRLSLILLLIPSAIEIFFNSIIDYQTPVFLTLRIVSTLTLIPISFFYKYGVIARTKVLWLFMALITFPVIVSKIQGILIPNPRPIAHYQIFYAMVCLTVAALMNVFRFVHVGILSIVFISTTLICQIIKGDFEMAIVLELFYAIFVCIRKYMMLLDCYKNYNQSVTYEKRRSQQSKVVSQLLPKHAYEKLKNQNVQNRLQLTDKFQNATMLFADIKGFTAYSNRTTPAGVVKMLKELFQEFDKSCMTHNVYKVYTIGDCYVVLGFTDCYKRNVLEETKNVVNMGLSMVDCIRVVRQKLQFPELDMRIGIHTGTIIGGIIGTEIVRYDIYGPDVMIANKFQEEGKTGFIHISEATKEILDQDKKKCFNIVPNGSVKVEKLNAEYNGYILTKKKFEI